ncbi:aminotransferase class V-fold PLP-dependent enzyme [Pseudoalteromonas sp. ACER1]|uniref:aminotransferase class V-fold PLP-dependent enzyme n=1 Tax=unclassified Pseudoalteromonas TaxID=194690 RepID=UPI001F40C72C|nr:MULTISPECIES: aminotransferase class V-fold PLP-dependent enzyme [unclassified Pseudoalteromonas]MCF2849244.1 aminotransferase class V-fold PLP-dependent enzyme [Pseudoalteromonas sp. PAST1]MCO7212683.1 aminotransferase class V-fold PLP-dependent enzyme [Pseudoalteromonas sp. ACER1]
MANFYLPDDANQQIYLDANATTPVLPEIADVVSHTMRVCFGNPSSSHITGIQAKHLLEQTRNKAREVIGATDGDILFTSGATEGIQTAVVSTLITAKNHHIENPVLLYGATEHKAVPNTLKHWNSVLDINAQVLAIPVDKNGILDHEFIRTHAANALMICTMAVNNETGVFQDLTTIEQVIRSENNNVAWMVDCVQALGKTNLALSQTTIDYAPFSGHKLYAPKGIGVLYIRKGSAYTPFIAGGGQESGMRSGTENLPGIAGLNKLFSLLLDKQNQTFKPIEQLHAFREQLLAALTDTFGSITFNHSFEHSVPTTLNFAVNELTSKEVMDLFDAAGIRVSGGSACSSGANRSFVLDAMGASDWQSENAIRMSFGPAVNQQEIDFACDKIRSLKPILEANCLVVSDSTSPQHEVCAIGLTQLRHQAACCWLYVDSDKSAVVIDPIIELIPRMAKIVATQGLTVKAIIDTHNHQERLSARCLLSKELAERYVANEIDELGWPKDSATIELSDACLTKVATPGHSDDSVSYLLSDTQSGDISYCFCGDLILPGGLGNTAISGGDAAKMAQSLKQLAMAVQDSTVICSGHDYQQCFAMDWHAQKATTPLLAKLLSELVSDDEFVELKQQADEQKHTVSHSLCGYVETLESAPMKQLVATDAKSMLDDKATHLIDTREPYEHGANNLAELFTVAESKVINIPLSRMANAIVQGQLKKDHSYILVCRSGNRSKQAANNLSQLGFENVYNLNGGLALL